VLILANKFVANMELGFLIHCPPQIKGEVLDMYLSAGWYRFGNKIFTIDFFTENEKLYQVYWLRYNVLKLKLSDSNQKILNKNKLFNYKIIPFQNSIELEALHSLYLEKIDFVTISSIEELMEDINGSVYNSMLIEIRDENKLIGAGIFDFGNNSIAGIKNIFHPDYKKYSLGKYLMLLKYQYCLQQNIKWYYPGYFAPGHKKFDYKLTIDADATEVCLIDNRQWVSYRDFSLMG
jgi:arginine-tRNA-protein transferase